MMSENQIELSTSESPELFMHLFLDFYATNCLLTEAIWSGLDRA